MGCSKLKGMGAAAHVGATPRNPRWGRWPRWGHTWWRCHLPSPHAYIRRGAPLHNPSPWLLPSLPLNPSHVVPKYMSVHTGLRSPSYAGRHVVRSLFESFFFHYFDGQEPGRRRLYRTCVELRRCCRL
jgi:hypothetical protein